MPRASIAEDAVGRMPAECAPAAETEPKHEEDNGLSVNRIRRKRDDKRTPYRLAPRLTETVRERCRLETGAER